MRDCRSYGGKERRRELRPGVAALTHALFALARLKCMYQARLIEDCMGHFRNTLSWQSCNLYLIAEIEIIAW